MAWEPEQDWPEAECPGASLQFRTVPYRRQGAARRKSTRTTRIELKGKNETIEALYDHWILGRNPREREPRWSILRNVLHVGE
jgi:hypothetical protein